MNEVIQEGVAVDPVVVPVSTPATPAEPAKEAAPKADEAPATN